MLRILRVPRPRHSPPFHLSNAQSCRTKEPRNYANSHYCRTFFWGSNDDENDNKGKNEEKTKKKETSKADNDEELKNSDSLLLGTRGNKVINPWRMNENVYISTGGGSSGAFLPSRVGLGDQAPRYPHLLGLPVVSRPLFPGIVTSVTLTDPVTIDAVEKLSNNGTGYIGVFLRKSEGGVLIDTPEVITDANQLFKVGAFAQIYKFNRDTGLNLVHKKSDKAEVLTAFEQTDGNEEEDNHNEENSDNDQFASLLLMSHRRINLTSVDNIGPPIDITAKHWDAVQYNPNDNNKTHDTIRALSNEILSTLREVAQLNLVFREHLQLFPTKIDANDPYRLADFVASVTTGSPEELQAVLEETDAEKRLHMALVLISKEKEVCKLQKEISANVEEKMTDAQRKYFLMEQLKSIKKELGMEKDDKEALITKYRKTMEEYHEVPVETMEVIESELEKLSTLEKNSPEFNVTRSYLDWLTGIPWGVTTTETFDIKEAKQVLDRDHYGLDDLKDIILQFIAVGKLKGSIQGKILCMVGPPGTGKTSIASSVADALGRKFYRFSVGGLSDVSEIKGHRRTYVGALPGKMIQCLKSTAAMNPLILIDEIDKLGRDFRGDPASALLELLDPSQNSTFRDHFLDLPVDMSKVLFMCTANHLDTIPGPLLDRMEIVHLSGYDVPDKMAIAENYLVPKYLLENGLMVKENSEKSDEETEDCEKKEAASNQALVIAEGVPSSLALEKSALLSLVRWYCREAGVRNLSKYIEKITRKLALQIVAEKEGTELTEKSRRKSEKWQVSDKNLDQYVGKPIYTSERLYDKDPVPHGVVMGLAWTSMGGCSLYIETQSILRGLDSKGKKRGGGTLKCTGQLGDVMSESTQIAYTVARSRLDEIQPGNTFYDDNDIHMHVPEGATPKDGPSAGITMVTAMLSLALGRSIGSELAMTGEISLTGKVLPVGGIKEKTMAAKRSGIRRLIFPSTNKRDYDELPDYLKEGLSVNFADEYSKVYKVAFEEKLE